MYTRVGHLVEKSDKPKIKIYAIKLHLILKPAVKTVCKSAATCFCAFGLKFCIFVLFSHVFQALTTAKKHNLQSY